MKSKFEQRSIHKGKCEKEYISYPRKDVKRPSNRVQSDDSDQSYVLSI